MTTRLNLISSILHWTVWANHRLLEAAEKTPQSWTDVVPIFSHIFAAEHIWLCRIQDAQPPLTVWPTYTWDDCKTWVEKNRNAIAALDTALSETALDRIVSFTSSTGLTGAMSVIDILLHLGTHGSYHRGQIAKMLGRLGGQVPLTDYFVYVREASTSISSSHRH